MSPLVVVALSRLIIVYGASARGLIHGLGVLHLWCLGCLLRVVPRSTFTASTVVPGVFLGPILALLEPEMG